MSAENREPSSSQAPPWVMGILPLVTSAYFQVNDTPLCMEPILRPNGRFSPPPPFTLLVPHITFHIALKIFNPKPHMGTIRRIPGFVQHMNYSKAGGLAIIVALFSKSWAQTNPSFGADVRAFGNNERLTYVGLSAAESFQNQFRLQVAGVFSSTSTFTNSAGSIGHGGTDVEFLGTYMPPKIPLDLSLGIGLPHTTDRGIVPALTYRASYRFVEGPQGSISIDSYGVAEPAPIVIVGLTGIYRFGHASLSASAGLPTAGQNSVNVSNDQRNRVGLYNVGLGWTCANNTLTLAITNQLGWTTGMMATPALGGYPGIEASWKVTF